MRFRFVVMEASMVQGIGTVVTGTVAGVPLETPLRVLMRTPDGSENETIVTSIRVRGETLARAEPGEQVRISLRGVRPPPVGTVLEGPEIPVIDEDDETEEETADPQATLVGVELSPTATALPLLLLPLRLETSFRGTRLRIRAYPDQIHVDSFDPRLTEEEVAAGRLYLAARADGRPEAEARQDLASTLGPIRGRLVADRAEDGGEAALRVESDGGLSRRAVARGLPRKLIAHGMVGGRGFTAEGREIPAEVPVAPGEGDDTIPGDGSPLDWMVDFQEAERIGLALTLDLDAEAARHGLDWLYVFGVDGDADGTTTFADLMRAHAGSDGATTLDPLVPTKGSPQRAPVYAVKGARADGARRLSEAVGLREELPLTRPAEADPSSLVQSIATIVWEASLRPALRELYGAGSDAVRRARSVYLERIHPFGPYPALKIGDQPYHTAPVAVPDPAVPRRDDDVLRRVGDAIRRALDHPSILQATDNARSRAGDPGGYAWMVDTLLRHPIGQHWRVRSRTTAEAYLTPIARAAGSPEADAAAQALMNDMGHGRQLLGALDLPLGPNTRVVASFGDVASPSVCGPLVAAGAHEDRTSESLADPGLESLLSDAGFWGERVATSSSDAPYYEDEEAGAEPILRLFAENAVLQVLGDLAVAEELATGQDADLVAQGVLDPDAVVIPRKAWHLRSRLASAVEEHVGGGNLEDIAARFRPRTPDGQARLSDLQDLVGAIRQVNNAAAGGTHAVFAALLDGLTTRVDMWLMAEAEADLERERRAGRLGVSIGGWGVLEDVRPGELRDTRHATAPSQEFATTLGLLERARRGLETTGLDGAIRAELTGPRVAEAREILELLRQGRDVGAALSRRVADKLNARGRGPVMEHVVAALRVPAEEGGAPSAFACDGLAFLDRSDFTDVEGLDDDDRRVLDEIQADLRAALEALGELHLAEGAAALAQRRVEAGQAVLQGLSAGAPPSTDLSILDPSSAGATLDFAVAACVDPSADLEGTEDLRTRLSPALAVVAEQLLGPVTGAVRVEAGGGSTVDLADLGVSALSLAHLAAPGTDGVERLGAYIRAREGLAEDAQLEFDDDARATLWAAGRLAAALGEGRPLRPDDVATEAEVTTEPALTAAASQAAENELSQLRDGLPAPEDATPADAAELFAAGLIPAPDPTLVDAARAALDARIDRAGEADDPSGALAALLADMPFLPTLRCGDPGPWTDGPLLQGALRGDLFVWLEESHAVRARLGPLADLMLGAESRRDLDVRAVQWPGTLRPSRTQRVDWIGAELREHDDYAARSSLVSVGGGIGPDGTVAGLLFDAWQEVVPDDTVTAGVVVDSPTPPARPPQLMLLAAPKGDGADWTPRSVFDALETAVAIGRVRMLGLGSLPEEAAHNGVFGRLGYLLPVGAIRSSDTALARATCPPVFEG